jgi:hypothetical protein
MCEAVLNDMRPIDSDNKRAKTKLYMMGLCELINNPVIFMPYQSNDGSISILHPLEDINAHCDELLRKETSC